MDKYKNRFSIKVEDDEKLGIYRQISRKHFEKVAVVTGRFDYEEYLELTTSIYQEQLEL